MKQFILAVALCAPTLAWATDPPHDLSQGYTCLNCHSLHQGQGAAITTVAGNANLCLSCHVLKSAAVAWTTANQASPGSAGHSHRWDAPAISADHGATAPTNAAMLLRVTGGTIQCSTCHDQHLNPATGRGSQRTNVAVASPVTRTAGTGTGTMVLNQPAAAATAKGYLVRISAGGATGTARFQISNDKGATLYGWNGTAWAAGVATGQVTGASVALNDGTNVTVTFSGTFVLGDQWEFYVAYPMTRIPNANAELCEQCHASRVQTSVSVESGGDGIKLFSHPIGESLAHSYDRAPASILDANGALQTVGDGLKTNNLNFDTTGKVRCLTCHGVHNVDSNSLTEDP